MNVDAAFAELGTTPIERLLNLMARLRDPDNGCPWDVEQTFETIAPYTIEEAYEVSEAIDKRNFGELEEELGDLLLQVVFHAQIAGEAGQFDFDSISDKLVRKMITRHPHVFGDEAERNSTEQTVAWEALKASERKTKQGSKSGVLDGIALALPSLMRAVKLQKRAARVGFDWPDVDQVLDKITEEAQEVIDARKQGESQERIHEEVGDLLFAVTNLARKLDVDPEHALRDTNQKFTHRFEFIENNGEKSIEDMNLEEMEELWVRAKQIGKIS